MRQMLFSLFLLSAAAGLLVYGLGCSQGDKSVVPNVKVKGEETPSGPPFYEDVTAATGINFTYRDGHEAGHYAILESLGGGVGLIDFDRDGLLDLFCPGGGYYDGPDKKTIKGHPCKLYKNLGGFKFQEVTAQLGLERSWPYTHGCAVGDFNNDGWPDLLVTGWGGALLFRNDPADATDPKKGRKFLEVTKKAGINDTRWSTSAGWADFDADGFPDVYICHYADWSFDNNPPCPGYTAKVPKDVCPPGRFKGLPDVLYRNNGDGTFTDMSLQAGLWQMNDPKDPKKDAGKGLGVVIADFNGDGRPDIYVANDTVDNFLYYNRGKWKFDELAYEKGVARDEGGVPQGSMGVTVGDYDGSGLPSIFVTNYENEMHALYRNLGPTKNELFLFSTTTAGIAAIGQRYVGFGTWFADVDHDGWNDIVIVNGHVIRHPVQAGLAQRPVLFHNQGKGKFKPITTRGGDYFQKDHRGRGLAVGDLDNDGWLDLVVSHVEEPLAVLRHLGGKHEKANHWLGIELVPQKPRDLVGAKIIVDCGGRELTGFITGGGSYLSACDPRRLFGLGQTGKVDRVRVIWPGGATQEWPGEQFTADRYFKLREGEKTAEK